MAYTRRDFLKMGALFVSIGATAPAFITRTVEAASSSVPRILVVVQLSGGNDGLNTVVPYTDPKYRELRPTIALPQDEVLPLDDRLAFHGAMTRLYERYARGEVAVIEGVGYPNPNRSHFRSMEIWHTAIPEKIERSGWIGRYLDANCCGTAPVTGVEVSNAAINIGSTLPLSFWTTHVLVPAIGTVSAFQFQTDGEYPDDRQNQLSAIREIYARASSPREYDEFVRTVGRGALETSERIQQLARTYTPQAAYPNDQFAQNLKLIAQLMQADLGTRIYYVALGGFDTHSRQARTHAALLKTFSDGIDAFLTDLEAQGKADEVLILSFSEFGRRVRQNGSDGTDHGTAAPMFAIGHKVRGGIHGAAPDLANLVDGDLKYEIDFRSVYSTVLESWLQAKPEQVLGRRYDPVPFLAR
ncbi:MAG: DUF1501 domain-containing protein [Chloroflexota bacterium]|nr:DUF1501 domain-containing protein [Dehalococcoidia bacterium]MDW8254584.1 DUF1501 domain-containing protein [Chloroflexota bacterium]